MINSYDINLIHSGDEDVKRMIMGVVSDYKTFFSLPKDFIININDDFDETMEKKYNETSFGTQPKTRKIDVLFEETDEDFQDNSITFARKEQYYVFDDTETGTKIAPVIKAFKYSLTVTISAKSKIILTSVLNKIRTRYALIKNNFRHKDVNTVCYLDNRTLILLNEINKKRKLLYPNETTADYVRKYRNETLVTVNSGNTNNNKNIAGIKTNFSNIYSMLTTEAKGLKVEYDSENKEHSLTLNFDLYLNLPISVNCIYPSVIFNQPLNKLFVQSIDPYKQHVGEPRYIDEFDKITRIQPALYTDTTSLYVNIPLWDTHLLPTPSSSYKRIFSILLSAVDHDPLVASVNLESISSKIKIKDDFIQFFKETEYMYMLDLLKSVFLINIYEDDKIVSNKHLSIDSNLNIFIKKEMNIKSLYRLSMSICINPNIITLDAYKRAMAKDIIAKLINNIIVINDIYNYETYRGGPSQIEIGQKYRPSIMKTVQTSHIQAAGLLQNK